MPTTRVTLLKRLNSLCASSPFSFRQAHSPFDFEHQPTGVIDQVYRIEVEKQAVIGGTSYSSEDTDLFTVWIARKQNAEPQVMYDRLVTDVTSLTAAIVRDGSTGGGDYSVPDGGGVSFQHTNGLAFSVARLSIPINYETQL